MQLLSFLRLQRRTVRNPPAVHPASGLEDSHVSTPEMLKQIRPVRANLQDWQPRTLPPKLGFDDLLKLVNDEVASQGAWMVFMARSQRLHKK